MKKSDLALQIKLKGYSTDEAAEKIGVSRKTLYNYFDKFDKGELSESTFRLIASELDLSKDFIETYKNNSYIPQEQAACNRLSIDEKLLVLFFRDCKTDKTVLGFLKESAVRYQHYDLAAKLYTLEKQLEDAATL